jgi:hypothetical protein
MGRDSMWDGFFIGEFGGVPNFADNLPIRSEETGLALAAPLLGRGRAAHIFAAPRCDSRVTTHVLEDDGASYSLLFPIRNIHPSFQSTIPSCGSSP